MMRKLLSLLCSGTVAMLAMSAFADTTDVKTQSIVEVKKRGAHRKAKARRRAYEQLLRRAGD